MSQAREKAAQVRENPAVRAVARLGFIAAGLVHILIGIIALVLAFGGRADGDQSGAMRALAGAPLGFVALWVIAIALWALAVWTAVDAFVTRTGHGTKQRAKGWGTRLKNLGRAVAYLAVGSGAAAVALGARNDSDESAQSASRDVLNVPGGPIVLGVVGVVIAAIGIGFVVSAFTRGFTKQMSIPDTAFGRTFTTLGVIGYLAEGAALLLVGILILIAAIKLDPSAAGGTDAALKALLATPFGPWAVGAIGIGLIAYGLFSALRSRFDRV